MQLERDVEMYASDIIMECKCTRKKEMKYFGIKKLKIVSGYHFMEKGYWMNKTRNKTYFCRDLV